MSKEYWYCCIGPAERSKLPWGSDGPLRAAVCDAFQRVTKHGDLSCASGWGVTADQKRQISFATYGDNLKRGIIASYHSEGRPLPRHMRAWELLFKEEKEE